ncbi:MAG: hypothetical protein MUQ10_03480, partial [Anaerolineae bacterium]|nr:hypothetical protein [Anaerolineae bacterium]
MKSTACRRLLLVIVLALTDLLVQGALVGPWRPEVCAAPQGIPQDAGQAARTPTLRPSLVRGLPLLEVQISADHWQGDIHIPERWGTELGTESRSSLHFRFQQSVSVAPSEVYYLVYRGLLPSQPGELVQPAASKLMRAVPSQAPGGPARVIQRIQPLASGSLGAPPGKGKTREFDIDFTKFLPAKPDEKVYHVRLAGPGPAGDGAPIWSSTAVKISYSQQPITQFPNPPTLKRVIGTRDALGHELTLSGEPLAVITQTFRLEGTDFCFFEPPFDTVAQFLKDGKIVKEVHPVRELSQKLPSGETSLAVRAPTELSGGPCYVRVKSGWGTSAQRRIRVGGNRPANVGTWKLLSGGVYENHTWTEECQGIATDGKYWYISSNNDGDRALYKFTIGMKLVARHDMEQYGSTHVGGLDCFDNKLYVALEGPKRLLVIGTDFRNAKRYKLHGSQINSPDPLGGTFAWCAVHPITGDVYTSHFDYAHEVICYKRADNSNYVYAGQKVLSKAIRRVQGGDITPAGKLILVSDSDPSGIYVYNIFTGEFYGAVTFAVDRSWNVAEELEGVTVSLPGTAAVKGSPVNVHLVLLDNDKPDLDDV